MAEPILARNNVKVFGRGAKTLLFAHGFGCDQNMWRFITPAFEDDYRIVLFDYVGSGQSDWGAYSRMRYGDLHGYAQDVLEICAALQLGDVIFVGHSVSGMIGLMAAIKVPTRFDRLLLIAPSPCYINHPPAYVGGFERADIESLFAMMDKNYLGWASFMAPVIMKNPEQPGLAIELEASFCSTDPDIMRRFAAVTFFSDNRKDLPFVQVPSLILQCSADSLAPREVGDYLYEQLSHSTLRVMEATGHCPHMSHPEETIALIKEYLMESRIG